MLQTEKGNSYTYYIVVLTIILTYTAELQNPEQT